MKYYKTKEVANEKVYEATKILELISKEIETQEELAVGLKAMELMLLKLLFPETLKIKISKGYV